MLVAARIIRYDTQRNPMTSFGLDRIADNYDMEVGIRVYHASTGKVYAEHTYSDRHTDTYPKASAPAEMADRSGKLIRLLLERSAGDIREAVGQLSQ